MRAAWSDGSNLLYLDDTSELKETEKNIPLLYLILISIDGIVSACPVQGLNLNQLLDAIVIGL